jgi:membrane-associated phospholipid phosphatase
MRSAASRFGPKAGLVLSLVGGFAALAVFTCLSAVLIRKLAGPLVTASFDAPVVQYAAAHRVRYLTGIMTAITAVGSDLSLWIAVLIGGAILGWLSRSWRPLFVLALVMGGAVSLDHLIKFIVARMRPSSLLWASPARDWSFPSGHATESAAVYLTLALMFANTQRRLGVKLVTYTIAIAGAFLIGVSRVYLGVHWPTDVIVGWALGFAWSAIVLVASSSVIQDAQRIR